MLKIDPTNFTATNKRELRNKKRWKEIHHLWHLLRQPDLSRWSIENAMCKYGDDQNVSIEHFMVVVIGEFGYDGAKKVESTLRKIHALFEVDSNSVSDWRQIYGALKVINLYRLIKVSPVDLLVQVFDIFSKENVSTNKEKGNSCLKVKNVKNIDKTSTLNPNQFPKALPSLQTTSNDITKISMKNFATSNYSSYNNENNSNDRYLVHL